MKSLTKEQILSVNDLRTERLEIPEWGGTVNVRTLTGAERDQLEASVVEGPGKKDLHNLRAKLVALSVVDDDGNRLFTIKDAVAIGNKSARALDRIFSMAQTLSGFSNKDVKDLTENLSEGQNDGSILP